MDRHSAPVMVLLLASCWSGAEAQSTPVSVPDLSRLMLPVFPAAVVGHRAATGEPASDVSPGAAPLGVPVHHEGSNTDREDSATTSFEGSSYVPMDSWVYPALDRLIALGLLQTMSSTIRPVTRLECARLVAEAHILAPDQILPDDRSGTVEMLAALDREFLYESQVIDGRTNKGSTVDRAYARVDGIAGTPLRDSFHFGQTIYNDFGRPYGEGGNTVAGVSGFAEQGPFAVYVRGEYQHAAGNPSYSAKTQQAIVAFDETREGWQPAPGGNLPPVFNFNPAPVDHLRLIEGYASLNLDNWQVTAGQQSLWYGPDRTTSLILSDNAAAMPMIRVARVKPAQLPGLLELLGPVHVDLFLAREGGIHYVALGETFVLHGDPNTALTPPPYMWGAAISVQPIKNFELTVSHTTIFAGYGRPLTLRTFIHTFNKGGNMQVKDPGKRVTEVDLTYHVPYLGDRLLVYAGAMAWDNPIEGHFTERFALDPGLYVPKVPFIPKLDLRLEGVYTDLPGIPEQGYFYANAHYAQGYTNYGQILGSWIGREGRGGEGTSTYWFSPRTKSTATYRKMVASQLMLEGGNLTDVSGSFSWLVNPRLELSTVQQYERWRFPLLDESPRSNFSTMFQVQLLSRPRL